VVAKARGGVETAAVVEMATAAVATAAAAGPGRGLQYKCPMQRSWGMLQWRLGSK